MIGEEKPVHYNRVFTITDFTINGIDCKNMKIVVDKLSLSLHVVRVMSNVMKKLFEIFYLSYVNGKNGKLSIF